MKNKIFAIIVTFNPEVNFFNNFLLSCANEFDDVVVVDNASSNLDLLDKNQKFSNVMFIKNLKNIGIGAAQNIGIKYAQENNATHFIFFDQDSKFDTGFLNLLLMKFQGLQASGCKVAAVGPSLIDSESGNSIPFISYKNGLKCRIVAEKEEVIECFALLSSGTLTSVEVMRDVGLFNEEYFIAYVDVEWCARADNLGYSCYGLGSAILNHSLGDNRYYIGKNVIPMHAPLRHYYVFRNGIFMLKSDAVPLYFKINDLIQLMRSFLIYLIFAPSKFTRLKFIIKGIFHGIINKGGKLKL